MVKSTPVPAITAAAGLAARAVARLEATASEVHATETARRDRELQLISTKNGFQAIIRSGRTLIEIQNDDFSVRQLD